MEHVKTFCLFSLSLSCAHLLDGPGDGSEGGGPPDYPALVPLALAQVQLRHMCEVMEGRPPTPGGAASTLASPGLPRPASRLRLLVIHLQPSGRLRGFEVEHIEVWRTHSRRLWCLPADLMILLLLLLWLLLLLLLVSRMIL